MVFQPESFNSTQKTFVDTLIRLGGKYQNFVVLNANVENLLGLENFERVFPGRYFQFGNAITVMISAAIGFAAKGKIPFLCAPAALIPSKNWQVLRNFAANRNIKIIGINAGLMNSLEGSPRQALEDLAIMRAIPGMKVFCPSDPQEAKSTIETMLLDYSPTYLRLYNLALPDLFDSEYRFVLGKGFVYKPGSDVCIFTSGIMLHFALEAAQLLERASISCMVVHLPSISPLDTNLIIECAKSVPHLVSLEDHQVNGGLSSAIAEALSAYYPSKLLPIGMEGLGESGRIDELYYKYGFDGASIAQKVQDLVRSI